MLPALHVLNVGCQISVPYDTNLSLNVVDSVRTNVSLRAVIFNTFHLSL